MFDTTYDTAYNTAYDELLSINKGCFNSSELATFSSL